MSKNKKILMPTENAESWRKFLADKDLHWKDGYSAKLLAYTWENSEGFPKEILKILGQHPDMKKPELLLAIPEYKVSLPGGSAASQNDVLAVFSTTQALSVMVVEGKAKEDFDDVIKVWKARTSETGVKRRLEFILQKIGIEDNAIDHLRYQLFHRLASAVIMAEKFHAKHALMVVQSFNNNDNENHFGDFVEFLKLYNLSSVEQSKLYHLTDINGIKIHAGWVYSNSITQ